MGKIWTGGRAAVGALLATAALLLAATAVSAIESEGEMLSRDRLVGNLGIAHADIGVYPDRAANNPAPEVTSGSDTVDIPAGATIVDSLVYWAGRGPGWFDDEVSVNGTTIVADTDYHWTGPDWDQTTYVADLDDAGITFSAGTNDVTVGGLDQLGARNYGAGIVVIYDHPSLPEVELELLEGNEFAFFGDTYFDEIGNSAEHTTVSCIEFAPSIESRPVGSFTRIMGVDAGRGDGPPRTQRLQWWTGPSPVIAPVVDGIVGIPTETPQGSVDNPVVPKVEATAEWGSGTYETNAPELAPAHTNYCAQVQSVGIGDGAGASLSLTNQGAFAETVHRLGNLVWLDDNADGMADLGEVGIDGVVVELWRDGATEALATTTTSDDGAYLFEGLLCGNYRVVIPGGQSGWTIAGEAVDVAALRSGSVSNPDANDDGDNDNNSIVGATGVTSGIVEIGDCGGDGDYANSASNEPTDETDRKGGPDDDPDELSIADGNYDDVRSNVSVDFAYERVAPQVIEETICDENSPAGAVDENGDPCEEISTEVEGQVEENIPLAVTGSTAWAYIYGALMVLVLGAWFFIASKWMRPVE